MTFKKAVRTFLVGRYNFIPNWAEYKVAILRGQLSVLCFLVAFAYLFVDYLNGVTSFLLSYLGVMAIAATTVILNRWQKFQIASTIYMLLINFMSYVFASNDTVHSGVYVYFLMCAITSFALFGYTNRLMAVLFCALSVFLFLSAYLFPLKFLSLSPDELAVINNPDYQQVSFIINFLAGLVICVSIVYFLVDLNFHSEKEILTKNDLLAKTNKELDRFVYSASHDLRAPLTSLLGLIELTQKLDDPEEIRQCLGMMKDRIHSLDDFIKEIIDFSRNARQEVRKDKVLLLDLAKETVEGLKFGEGMEKIFVRFDIPPALEITTDRARLKVVLNNLIGNAFKYHDPEKEHQEVFVRASMKKEEVHLDVEDNGIGIDAQHVEKIFDMFYRATEKSSGSGLGLYIVKETVTKLNGHVMVSSAPGTGTCFHMTIPG